MHTQRDMNATHTPMTVRLVHNDGRTEDVEILVRRGERITLPPEVLVRSTTAFVLDMTVASPVETCACGRCATVHYLYREHVTLFCS